MAIRFPSPAASLPSIEDVVMGNIPGLRFDSSPLSSFAKNRRPFAQFRGAIVLKPLVRSSSDREKGQYEPSEGDIREKNPKFTASNWSFLPVASRLGRSRSCGTHFDPNSNRIAQSDALDNQLEHSSSAKDDRADLQPNQTTMQLQPNLLPLPKARSGLVASSARYRS
jgi:hypothetical protein